MREQPGFRETVAYLNERTNGKAWLTVSEIAEILGVDRSTVNRRFGIYKGCAITVLAQRMIAESR